MRVHVIRETKTQQEVDIEFPVYRYGDHSGDSYTGETWYRYDADGTCWSISRSADYNGRSSWEIERWKWRGLDMRTIEPVHEPNSDASSFRNAYDVAQRFFAAAIT